MEPRTVHKWEGAGNHESTGVDDVKREDWHQVFIRITQMPQHTHMQDWQLLLPALAGYQNLSLWRRQPRQILYARQWQSYNGSDTLQTEVGLRITDSSSPLPLSALRTLIAWLRLPRWQTRTFFSGQTHQPERKDLIILTSPK